MQAPAAPTTLRETRRTTARNAPSQDRPQLDGLHSSSHAIARPRQIRILYYAAIAKNRSREIIRMAWMKYKTAATIIM
jgi:hypothetical protein